MVTGQSSDAARILGAQYDADNNLVIQIEIPADTTILDVSILLDGSPVQLDVNSEPTVIEQWFIIDTSESMLNAYGLLKDELQAFVANADDTYQIGGVLYGADAESVMVSNSSSEFDVLLSDYIALPATQSCVIHVLNVLQDLPSDAYTVRQILVIAGDIGDDTACSGGIPELGTPIDFIVVGNQPNSLYHDIANQSGGTIYQSALLGLSSYFDELANPQKSAVYIATIPVNQVINSATVNIELANGDVISESIQPLGKLTIVPTATPIPATATSTPTESESTEVAELATAVDTLTPTPESTELAVSIIPTQTPVSENTTQPTGVSNSQLIIVGGIAAVVVVIIVMASLLGFGRSRQSRSDKMSDTDYDTTLFNYDDEAEFDETDIVTIRQIASKLGPTHVANLFNEDADVIYEIHRPVSNLGRQIGSDILIAGDNQISREHVRFTTRDDGSIWITRMTRNPILINGIPMETTRELNDGDIVQLSPNLLVIFKQLDEGEEEA